MSRSRKIACGIPRLKLAKWLVERSLNEALSVIEGMIASSVVVPFTSEKVDKLTGYCHIVRDIEGCPDCELKKRYGKGEKCPIVVSLS